jgi:translation initiation factor IF-3
VLVIGDEGEQLGVMATRDALEAAKLRGLDLVEVSPNSDPPVCRILDYGKYKYQNKKKAQESKKRQTVIHVKEVKFRPKTDEHDYQTKLNHIKRFLSDGNKAKISLKFRGREMLYIDKGREKLMRVLDDVKDYGHVETAPQMEGKNMFMMAALPHRKPAAKPAAGKEEGKKPAKEGQPAAEAGQQAPQAEQQAPQTAGAPQKQE